MDEYAFDSVEIPKMDIFLRLSGFTGGKCALSRRRLDLFIISESSVIRPYADNTNPLTGTSGIHKEKVFKIFKLLPFLPSENDASPVPADLLHHPVFNAVSLSV